MDRVTDEALVDEIRGGSTVAFVELMLRGRWLKREELMERLELLSSE